METTPSSSPKKPEVNSVSKTITNLNYFKPHVFKTAVRYLDHKFSDFMVLIDTNAFAKMSHYVSIAGEEVGWFGTVRRNGSFFIIEDVKLFDQEVHSTTTEISEEGLCKFVTEQLETPEGTQWYEKMKYWGHSHVNMGTGASGQDEAQMRDFKVNGHEWFLRGIHNKKGESQFSLFLFKEGIVLDDVPWRIYCTEEMDLKKEIEAEFKLKVKPKNFGYQRAGIHVSNEVVSTGHKWDRHKKVPAELTKGHVPSGNAFENWWEQKETMEHFT